MAEQETQQNTYQSSTKRIAKNTLMLYFRQILILLVSLYTVRVVLNTLGAEDYGIYNVVAGVVTMFSFLSGAMATASQRYFAFEMGRGNEEGLQKVFSVTMTIYVLLALIIVVLAETVGLWFVNTRLVIPAQRMTAARWIYQFAILSFMVTLLTTPYMASIIAHENMNVYAYVSIVEATLKLGIVFVLRVLPYDKLIVYGILLLIVACVNTGLYRGYCKRRYAECRFRLLWDNVLFNEMVSYSGWNLMGTLSGLLKNQGINILLNMFFGPVVNAARAIAYQINSAVDSFAQNFSVAVRPQIIKSYSVGNYIESFSFVYLGSKGCFLLMLILSVPVLLRTPYLLSLWLKAIPDYTVLFTRLVIINALIDSLSYTLIALMSAQGKLKVYQLVVSSITLMNLPLSFVFLRSGYGPEITMILSICISICALFARLFVLKYLTGLPVLIYLKKVLVRVLAVGIVVVSMMIFLDKCIANTFLGLIIICFLCVFVSGCMILVVGVTQAERKILLSKIQITNKIK